LAGGRPLTGRRPAPLPGVERQPGTGRKQKMLQKIQEFFKEVSVELKKVSWPTRQQTMNATVVVITVSFIVAFFLGIVDVVLARVVGSIMK
jgi:preprotein translocase subunit SecE